MYNYISDRLCGVSLQRAKLPVELASKGRLMKFRAVTEMN